MDPGETIRFRCEECQLVFDLSLGPASERADLDEGMDEGIDPVCCPFCGSGELARTHDRALSAQD